ncbi:hypothetical protein PHYBLDRAFT_70624 [Phycomyces blakesleeanus NRRL 1555(-)]|uniref:Uncharacterized protein n=1 Tax=Phycomyces blakesleeanus (strain ATCC 8743b / DSM 1359 / FGSC 10004 / NBRC 33097 / NRRL 1555) TaxID=763407 RepID=A0A162PMX4_PHYB8|nr:hypothetical protein PHYBLDRAFT_70624 [Phycomyces blakesleeanus NRRL 1555(-)]OAD70456.1 hypothetical protein PHYBLDRAFT_70624 [Phycomyces blakesleeanus NRRL 1555(-)]|eukprot:XP_018288496.1 hypothetical protein PHYBLDRAFT_70624 [Phycomyces blakesleeanus NRRL 1555(-)]
MFNFKCIAIILTPTQNSLESRKKRVIIIEYMALNVSKYYLGLRVHIWKRKSYIFKTRNIQWSACRIFAWPGYKITNTISHKKSKLIPDFMIYKHSFTPTLIP